MKTPKKNWTVIRTLLFVIIGLLNTVFIRPEDIGTWKNYMGYGLLVVAATDMFFLFKTYLTGKKIKSKCSFTFLKILAFVIPFYFVYYGPMHENPENPKIKILWKYVLTGFLTYVLLLVWMKISKEF